MEDAARCRGGRWLAVDIDCLGVLRGVTYMASKPTQRSLAYLRKNGWTVCIVEKFLPARGGMPFPRRIDAFNIGDLLACKTWVPQDPTTNTGYEQGKIALVQTTDASSFSKHRAKILAIPEFQKWKDAGGIVLLHGWAKRGPRGERKVWTLREEVL